MNTVPMSQHRLARIALAPATLSLLVLFATPVAAQAPDSAGPSQADASTPPVASEDAEFSEEMVVTATRRPEATATVPGSVTVITQEQLAAQSQVSHRSLGDALGKLVPGLSLGSQSASSFGQTLRGRNVLVMIDGVPQSAVRNVQHDLQGIDLSTVERVEVVRGTTAIYGEGASGGIINIITRSPQGVPGLRFTTDLQAEAAPVRPGESLGGTLAQTLEGERGPFRFSLAGSLSRTGGFFDARGDRIPPDPHGQGGLADMTAFNLFGKVAVKLAPEQRLRFSANHYQGLQDTRFTVDPSVTEAPALEQKARAVEGLDLPDPQGTRNSLLSLLYDHDALLGSSVRAQLYYRTHLARFFPFDGRRFATYGHQIVQSRLEPRKGGGRVEVGTPLLDGLSALWGLDASRERTAQPVSLMDPEFFTESGGRAFRVLGERGWVPRMDISTLGLFAQLEWQALERLTLRAGVRHERAGLDVGDYTTLAGDDIPGASLSFARTLFNAGVVARASQQLNAFINFSQGYSLPDVGLILRNAPAGSTVASLDTAPQAVDLLEVGVRGDWEQVQGSVSVFYNRSDLGTSSGGFNAPVVRAPERIYGVEATFDVQPVERLSLGTTFSWLEGQFDKENDGTYAFLNSYRIPPLKLTGSVEHETLPGWRNGLVLVYSGRRNRFPTSTAFGERPVKEYFTVDLMSSVGVGPGTLRVGISNLLNRQYFTRESQLLRTGANDSYSAARGALVSVGYAISY
jgi:iron complex outermembrane receptor protein